MRSARKIGLIALSVVAFSAGSARAEDPPVDEVKPDEATEPYQLDRTWLYVDDASVVAPMHAVAISRLTYTGVGSSPTRPFSSNIATPGGMFELGGEAGLVSHLSVEAVGVAGESGSPNATGFGGVAALRLSLLPDAWKAHLVLSSGYLRELDHANGAWARVSATGDVGRLRLTGDVHGEHVFLTGRDGVDVMVAAGATYRIAIPRKHSTTKRKVARAIGNRLFTLRVVAI